MLLIVFAHKHKTKHRDFSIRLSNSSHSLTRFDKNKLRQTPPHLEKSDEDCVTPQDISLDTDNSVSSKNLNISSSSGNANFSSDSTSFDDSNDRIAPVICSSSEISEFQGKKKVPTVQQFRKSMDVLRPPNITSSEPHSSTDVSSLPPNLCCSDASESVAKEEATVKSSTRSVASDGSNNRPIKRQATTSSSDIQPKKQKAIVKAEMVVVKQEKIKKTRKVSQSSKSSKGVHFHKYDSDKIQALLELNTGKEKKSVPPSRPKSIFSHMSNIIGGSGSGGGSFTPSTTASTSMVMGTTSTSTSNKISGTTCQSMEELLEWQWDQTGTLLMQQAESSDIASLLSCLHDLKNENEQLLSKQLKLSHRRDHLKAVNAKLQLQLATKTSSNASLPSINTPQSSTTTTSLEKTFNRPPTISNSQASTKPVSKSHKPITDQQPHYKAAPLSNIPNGDIRTSRSLSDSKTTFIQPQLQQPPILSNSGWATTSSSKVGESQMTPQAIALLKHYQQQQQHGLSTSVSQTIPSAPSVSNIISQTDLVTFLNNQLHSQLASNSQPTTIVTATHKPISQDIHIAPNNGNNMELIYQAIQQKKQQQLQQQQQQQQLQLQHSLPSHFYYHNPNNKIPSSASTINNLDNSVSQTPENTSK